MNVREEALKIQEELIRYRRDLHQIPETDITLPKTTAYVSRVLTSFGIEHTVYSEISCLTAVLGKGDKCLLLRSDMDGLPLEEKSGEPFASVNGCAHACGHDLHAAVLLGAAKLLKEHEEELSCQVKLLFQSGEETFHGAAAAIRAGVMESPKVDHAYAMHVFAGMERGEILYGMIPMGAVYGFSITLTGKGGHGSQPENCIDPINAGVQVYLALQSLIARELAPLEAASLTIGQFCAGAAANAIPDTAVLKGTLRTFDNQVREMLIKRITEVGECVAKTYRCGFSLEVINDCPSLMNDKDFCDRCLASIEKTGIIRHVNPNMKVMGSEDFAFISQMVPSCYLVAGAGPIEEGRRKGQHDPFIVFNEDALADCVSAYVQVALDYR